MPQPELSFGQQCEILKAQNRPTTMHERNIVRRGHHVPLLGMTRDKWVESLGRFVDRDLYARVVTSGSETEPTE